MVRTYLSAALVTVMVALSCPPSGRAAGSDNSSLANDPEFRKANALVEAGQWLEALPILIGLEADIKDSPDVYNLLGVTYRKLKDYPTSKQHYDRALALDPQHLPTLEYQGEWFIETGDLVAARSNLETLKRLCGTCHAYEHLAEAIARAEQGLQPAD